MQPYVFFQDLRQNDNTVSVYLQKANALFDKLAAVGRPFSLEDFNLYVLCGLRGDFGDLVTTFSTRTKPISHTDLHNHLLTHEFLHKASFQPIMTTPLLSTLSQPPSTLLS
jgi:hypothetical protein